MVDVLCVNCYQCIPFNEVDSHSLECQTLNVNKYEGSMANMSQTLLVDDEETNERIYKLGLAIK
jgi:hypothetical protein